MPKKPAEIVSAIVDMLEPLPSEDRQRVVKAALTLLGEGAVATTPGKRADHMAGPSDLPAKVTGWMRQNGVSADMLEQVFHIKDGMAEVIAEPPGKSQREKTINAYVLTGIARFISAGETSFDDQVARDLCTTSGCYSSTNHATYLKDKGTDFTGNSKNGWSLTSPGLKRGALLIKSLSASSD